MNTRICFLAIVSIEILTLVLCTSTTSSILLTCPGTQEPCGNKLCYDPATQSCTETGSVVTCINACRGQCYNLANQICINGTLCSIREDVCEVKYDGISGKPIVPPQLQCYNTWSKRCLNHTICYEKDRHGLAGRPGGSSGANDNVTLCDVPLPYSNYKPNQIQLCNGTCYDTSLGLKHCVNGSVQCVSNCSNVCYNATTHICINGAVCYPGQDACRTNYSSYDGSSLGSSRVECYSPLDQKCVKNALCSNGRICDEQCVTGPHAPNQVCANDKRTICNMTNRFSSYRPYQIHLCNGYCYDTTIRQCVNGIVSCIDEECGDQCYDPHRYICINNTICGIGSDLCEVKYDSYSGKPLGVPPRLQCYNLKSQKCLNNTICSVDRACAGQCMTEYNSRYQLCVNNTICAVDRPYTDYQLNHMQSCNGSCFDFVNRPLKHCINGTVQCKFSCSNYCYDETTYACINETLCYLGGSLCQTFSGHICYNPLSQTCLNGAVCANNRVCDGQCLSNSYQVCATDNRTICNVTKPYHNYGANQMHLCLGVCFDSAIEQCSGEHIVLCIHDPVTQLCVPQSVNSSTTTSTASSSNISSTSFSTFDDSSTIPTDTDTNNSSTVLTDITLSPTSNTSSMSTSSTTFSSSPNRISSTLSSEASLLTTLRDSSSVSASTNSEALSISSSSSLSVTDTSSSLVESSISTVASSAAASDTSATLTQTSSIPTSDLSASTTPWTTLSPQTTTLSSTATVPSVDSCCAVKKCTKDADCCVPGIECQCYRHNFTSGYGSCLNPYVEPICADGCLQNVCLFDTDCCKCQCASVMVTDVNGNIITKKQCLLR